MVARRTSWYCAVAAFAACLPVAAALAHDPRGVGKAGGASEPRLERATNGVPYQYAVTAVARDGGEALDVASTGPRTPRGETDLQVVTIARTPRYPRYWPIYSGYNITEPSGFGPYHFTAATSLGGGQNAGTQRWPDVGDTVTYTATVRNRGTNPWSGALLGTWRVDGAVVDSESKNLTLAPGDVASFELTQTWDDGHHEIGFEFDLIDGRLANNSLSIWSKSVAFLSYVDQTYYDDFRASSAGYPNAVTDDFLDWINYHMRRFNEMFEQAGTRKRVHMDVFEILPDDAPDPPIETIYFAVFPFRYRAGDGSLRLSGYYSPADDIDYGLLHEMGHQLGLIDIYRLNVSPAQNQVSGSGYTATACLMNGVSPFISQHSADAMEHWLETAHGYFGQYLYRIPTTVRVRILGFDGQPLSGATVRVYQKVERPGMGEVITNQVKATGTTDGDGIYVLPNVPIDPDIVPPAFNGDVLHDNPFGYVAVIGTNGVLLLEVEQDGFIDYAWLDIVAVNNAYSAGHTEVATFTRTVALGGPIQETPPQDMAEENAADWVGWADGGEYELFDDVSRVRVGDASVRTVTTGGFDTYARYPGAFLAEWDLSRHEYFGFWVYAENDNIGFQERSPWIRLRSADGYVDLRPPYDVLNEAIGQWVYFEIPLAGDSEWQRTQSGSPDMTAMRSVEIHADTWGAGFSLWLDGVGFGPPPTGDLDGDGDVDFQDMVLLLASFNRDDGGDLDGDGDTDFDDLVILLANYGS